MSGQAFFDAPSLWWHLCGGLVTGCAVVLGLGLRGRRAFALCAVVAVFFELWQAVDPVHGGASWRDAVVTLAGACPVLLLAMLCGVAGQIADAVLAVRVQAGGAMIEAVGALVESALAGLKSGEGKDGQQG